MSSTILKLLPVFPLLAFLINSLILRTRADVKVAGIISTLGTFVSFVLTCILWGDVTQNGAITTYLWEWVALDGLSFNVSFLIDELSVILTLMVTGIGTLITLFSMGYMDHDERPGKFFSYLSLFIFSMLLLALSENFLVLFFGWEGVGLCSYLLIGFWYTDIEKAKAGRKAFVVNRIGDFGVILGIIAFAMVFKSISFTTYKDLPFLSEMVANNSLILSIAGLLILLGVTGKSAQMPLYVWLPDAMAGPTPVSALIHAATMVTAGVFLLCRLSPILSHLPLVLDVAAWIGAITALLAALIAITQQDIKKVLAYSTVSQLGYMVLACGVGAFSTAMFHVFTHAFFKALLFLGAGAVIYSLHHEQNLMRMGNLKNKLPVTFWCFVVALLAIAGFPGFAGFFSKDEILWLTLNKPGSGVYLYGIAAFTALLTAFYMTRLVCLAFLSSDKTKDDPEHPITESPKIMTIPLVILAIFSALVGYLGLPHFMSHANSRMFQRFVEKATVAPPAAIYSEHTEHLLMGVMIVLIISTMGLAYYLYTKKESELETLRLKLNKLWTLSSEKFYVDELYESTVVRAIVSSASFLVRFVEKRIIDGVVRASGILAEQSGVYLKNTRAKSLEANILLQIIGLAGFLIVVFSMLAKW